MVNETYNNMLCVIAMPGVPSMGRGGGVNGRKMCCVSFEVTDAEPVEAELVLSRS